MFLRRLPYRSASVPFLTWRPGDLESALPGSAQLTSKYRGLDRFFHHSSMHFGTWRDARAGGELAHARVESIARPAAPRQVRSSSVWVVRGTVPHRVGANA